ncbi:TPA: IS1 family transposase [Morganella morganii]|nr:IS1 family transposase [Providencia stuartii]HCR4041672.1 IS1 family transposase [Morganella morganii]HEK2070553.1 IS1 family transposase [Proteus mirabilis]
MATVTVKCRFCGLTAPVKKHGTGNGGHPRYRCQDCSRTFQLDYCATVTTMLHQHGKQSAGVGLVMGL